MLDRHADSGPTYSETKVNKSGVESPPKEITVVFYLIYFLIRCANVDLHAYIYIYRYGKHYFFRLESCEGLNFFAKGMKIY